MMSYFYYFIASFLAITLWWTILQCLERHVPFTAVFSKRRFYFLSFIHGRIVEMQLAGEDEQTILNELREFKFPFAAYPNKKWLDDLAYIRELVGREDLVRRYLLQRDFSFPSYKKLCTEFGSPLEEREKAARIALCQMASEPGNGSMDALEDLFVELLTPPFVGADDANRISAGENELSVYSAALDAGALRSDCSKAAFADCMRMLGQVHPEMQVVKSKQGLSTHIDKPMNPSIRRQLIERFEAVAKRDR